MNLSLRKFWIFLAFVDLFVKVFRHFFVENSQKPKNRQLKKPSPDPNSLLNVKLFSNAVELLEKISRMNLSMLFFFDSIYLISLSTTMGSKWIGNWHVSSVTVILIFHTESFDFVITWICVHPLVIKSIGFYSKSVVKFLLTLGSFKRFFCWKKMVYCLTLSAGLAELQAIRSSLFWFFFQPTISVWMLLILKTL